MIHITEQLRREEELARINLQLERMATTDSLTGLSNRRVFESQAVIEFSRANRNQRPLSVLVLDIDNFKLRNDTYGDAAGDAALAHVDRQSRNGALKQRPVDFDARRAALGGGE
jgi:two-component system chemotaxis family response regulator WspR